MRRPRPVSPLPTLVLARSRLRRRVLIRWAVSSGIIVVTTALVLSAVHRADRAEAHWGERVDVVVANHPLEPGHRLLAGDVDVERWPAGLLPVGSVASLTPGRTVTASIAAGEPIVDHRLGPEGLSGVTALLPAGTRALAIPRATTGLDLTLGDQVDLFAGRDLFAPEAEGGAVAIAAGATVVAVHDDSVTVAVAVEQVAAVAGALTTGTVTLALTRPGQPEYPEAASPSTSAPSPIR